MIYSPCTRCFGGVTLDGQAYVTRVEKIHAAFTRARAVAALRPMIGSSYRDPAQYAWHSGIFRGGNPVGGARSARAPKSSVRYICAGGWGRSRNGLRRTRATKIEWDNGLLIVVVWNVRLVAGLALWCDVYCAPQVKERGMSFGLA